MAHPNEELLKRGYEAFGTGDLDTVFSVFADDITWHVGGSSPLAGDYKGHDQVMGFFSGLMEMSGGTFSQNVHDILANDSHGAVMVTFHVERGGRSLDGREVHIWHLANGKATKFWGLPEDQAALDELFS